jgi:hypothetical protein
MFPTLVPVMSLRNVVNASTRSNGNFAHLMKILRT